MRLFSHTRSLWWSGCMGVLLGLAACSSGPDKPKMTELGPDPAKIAIQQSWVYRMGPVEAPLEMRVNGSTVTLASAKGGVVALDARTGTPQWRLELGVPISAGVGSDGRFTAVVTQGNELVVLDGGRESWRARLTAKVFTAPLVAGERVFVQAGDRSVLAFDAKTGRKLWQNQRPGEALVLRQAGLLTAVQNTLVVGFSGRIYGMNPLTGAFLWDAAIANPRGTNDIERLVDLVSGVGRDGDQLCVRAFQSAVGCVDGTRGVVTWKNNANGSVGLAGDGTQVYGVEEDGRIISWKSTDGVQVWQSDSLRYRELSPPTVVGRSIAVGDQSGWVHLLSRADGTTMTRVKTDGSAVSVAPALVEGTLVVATRNGAVYGFLPR